MKKGKVCSLENAHCKNSYGKIVPSKLWLKLGTYFPRPIQQKWYKVGTAENFLQEARKDHRYKEDENGQITFDSLNKIAGIRVARQLLIQRLNQSYKEGNYNFQEAIAKLQDFNNNNDYKSEVMAVLSLNSDGSYHFSIGNRTNANENSTAKAIMSRNLQDRLIYQLQRRGADATFLQEEGSSRYSTINAEKTANSLYNLITIFEKEGADIDAILAEESGHFAVACQGNTPLVKRLEALLTDDVIRNILGEDEYNKKDLGVNPAREMAGYLVGQYLYNKNAAPKGVFSQLVNRIITRAEQIFYGLKKDTIKNQAAKAKILANKLAQGYLNVHLSVEEAEDNLNKALSTKETLYSNEDLNINIQTFNRVKHSLERMVKITYTLDKSYQKKFKAILSKLNSEVNTALPEYQSKYQAVIGITKALEALIPEVDNIYKLIQDVDFNNIYDFNHNAVRNAKSLRTAKVFIEELNNIITNVNEVMPINSILYGGKGLDVEFSGQDPLLFGVDVEVSDQGNLSSKRSLNLNKLLNQLKQSLSSDGRDIMLALNAKEKAFYLKFLEGVLGRNYIERSNRILYEGIHIKKVKGGKVTLEQLLHAAQEGDMTTFDKWKSSMSNASDVILQICDMAAKQANKKADDDTEKDWQSIRSLKEQWKQLNKNWKKDGLDTLDISACFEVDDNVYALRGTDYYSDEACTKKAGTLYKDRLIYDVQDKYGSFISQGDKFYIKKEELSNIDKKNQFTGNFLTQYNFYKWENDYEQYKRQIFEDFKEEYKDTLNLVSTDQKELMWLQYRKDWERIWHFGDKENGIVGHSKSVLVDPTDQSPDAPKMLIPNTDYDAKDFRYTNLDYVKKINNYKGLEEFLVSLYSVKKNIDSALPTNSSYWWRVPQFKGTFINKIKNRTNDENLLKSTWHTIRGEFRDTFVEDAADTEFGSNQTYNNPFEDVFEEELAFEEEKINRIPLYGINKMKPSSVDRNKGYIYSKELSTDLFSSMLAYSSMARTNEALNQIVDAMEIGKDVLAKERRPIQGIDFRSSNTYSRLLKFMDMQIYGLGIRKNMSKKIVLVKLSEFLNGLASKIFLGGNIHGGLVNLGTGFIELFKEAAVGEDMDMATWAKANKIYWTNLGHNMASFFTDIPNDKLNTLMRHWNVSGDTKQQYRSWHTRRNGAMKFLFEESLFFPYKFGEHYMQTVSYLAVSLSTKLYNVETGEEKNLWEIYSKEGTFDNTKWLKNASNIDEYNQIIPEYLRLNDEIDKLKRADKRTKLTNAYKEQLKQKENEFALLESKLNQIIFSKADESRLMDKAREMNNRMHGIYNKQDKVFMQSHWLSNMLLSMKGYALGYIERKFSRSKYSVALGRESEGSFVTLGKVLMVGLSEGTVGSRFWNTIRMSTPLSLIPAAHTEQLMEEYGFSSTQYKNIRRISIDVLVLAALLLIVATTKLHGGDDDDDEDGDQALGIINYFANRLLLEQSAYLLPMGIIQEWRNIGNLTPAGVSVLQQLGTLAVLYGGSLSTTYDAEKAEGTNDSWVKELLGINGGFYYHKKESSFDKGDPKYLNKLYNMLPYYRSIKVFKDPYEATASYEYGRRLKTR